MGNLTTTRRNALPKSEFGLPGSRKYPMPDRSHAINAKARAAQQLHKGALTEGEATQIIRKANRVLKGRGT